MNDAIRGDVSFDVPLAKYTSWRVGGPARRFFRPADIDDLVSFLATLADDKPLLWMGLGSNLLVRDGGFDGTVICTRGRLKAIQSSLDYQVTVEAGASCAQVARFCAEQELVGAEFLAGIPGTMGGALAMNAGAFGGETWGMVETVQTVDRRGVCRDRDVSEFKVGYRSVQGVAGEWFLTARLRLQTGDTASAQAGIRSLLARRAATQPLNLPSCGSVFKNPAGDYAARLIEASGLKGYSIGGAQVSEKHANFIVNTGDACAADIENLIHHVAKVVEQQHEVILETEVRVVGEFSGGVSA